MSKIAVYSLILALLVALCIIPPCKPLAKASTVENSWVEKAPMQQARACLGVASANGKIYAIGGSTASGFEPAYMPYADKDVDHFVGTNEEYDPTNNSWNYKAPMPTPRMAFAIAAFQGRIYCIGGRSIAGDSSGGYTSVNEAYDPTTNSWETKASMPVAKAWIQAKMIDDKIFILDSTSETSKQYYVYDPTEDTWNSSVPSPQDGKLLLDYFPSGYETTGVHSTKMIYTFNNDFNSRVEAYNPQNHTWQDGVASLLQRYGFGIALENDIFYVVGGYTYLAMGPFAPVATNEEFIPFGYGTPDPTYAAEHFPPSISILSPINQTYNEANVSLVFSSDKNTTWTQYSLDGQQNITVTGGNTTVTDLSNGTHKIAIYANDTYGNIGKQEITFTINKPQQNPTNTTNIIIAISAAASILAISVVVFMYRRREKFRTNRTGN